MPNTVNQTIFQDGSRKAVVHLYLESDGNQGEFKAQKIIDGTSDLVPKGQPTQLTIQQIWWSQSFYDATLYTDDTVPVPLWVLSVNGSYADFRSVGGLKIPVDMDGRGNLMISTTGFAPLGSCGSYVIELKKD